MKQALALMLLCLCSVFGVSAQTTETTQTTPVTVIRGVNNTSQISDEVAYRLYFYILTNEAQAENFSVLGLNAQDTQAAVDVLKDFKSQDASIRSQHEMSASSNKVDRSAFQADRDTLVQNTRVKLSDSLSKDGMQALDNAVQNNKANVVLTVAQNQPVESSQTSSPPPIFIEPCAGLVVTWYPSTAQMTTYTTTQNSEIANTVFDGYASYSARFVPSGCTPKSYSPVVYTPQVYNVQNIVGGWTIGTPVTAGAEFNVGSVTTYTIVLGVTSTYETIFGQGLGGSESTYGDTFQIIVPIEFSYEFEIAYERTSSLGIRTGCTTNPESGVTSCLISQTPWCNLKGTPPDLNVQLINVEVSPVNLAAAYKFFENFAGCRRQLQGWPPPAGNNPWVCSPALSIGNPISNLGLGLCTRTP